MVGCGEVGKQTQPPYLSHGLGSIIAVTLHRRTADTGERHERVASAPC